MSLKIEYLALVDMGDRKRWVILIHNEENNRIVPFSSGSGDFLSSFLDELGFGILVKPKAISLSQFWQDVKNNTVLNQVNWEEMGVHL